MLFLEADLAIFKRLTGWPLDGGGRPLRGEDGLPVNRSWTYSKSSASVPSVKT